MIKSKITEITNRNLRTVFELNEAHKSFTEAVKKIFMQESFSDTWVESCNDAFKAISPYLDETHNEANKKSVKPVFDAIKRVVDEVNRVIVYNTEKNQNEMLSPLISDVDYVLPTCLSVTYSSDKEIEQSLKVYAENIVTGDFDITDPNIETFRQLLALAFITKKTLDDNFTVGQSIGDLSVHYDDDYFIRFDFGVDDLEDGTNIEFSMQGYGSEVEGDMHCDSDEDFSFEDTETLSNLYNLMDKPHTDKDLSLFIEVASKGGTPTEIFYSISNAIATTKERTPFVEKHIESIQSAVLTNLIENPDSSHRKDILNFIKGIDSTTPLMHRLLGSQFASWVSHSSSESEYLMSRLDQSLESVKKELDWSKEEILNAVSIQLVATKNYQSKAGDLEETLDIIVASKVIPFEQEDYTYLKNKISSAANYGNQDYESILSGLSSRYLGVTVDKKLAAAGSETRIINHAPLSF
jgi:hypothetical protein